MLRPMSAHKIPESAKRLREFREAKGLSRSALADAVGAHHNQIQKLENGERRLTVEWIDRLARALDISPDAFVQKAPLPKPANDEHLPVPVYDVRASAGPGSLAEDGAPSGFLMFREPWLKRISQNPQMLVVLEISGDSMWDTLHDGDHALVDRSQVNPRREGLYVLRIDDVLQVKRISMHPVSRLLTIKSDNPAYPTYDEISPEEISVIGRVIWIGRALG